MTQGGVEVVATTIGTGVTETLLNTATANIMPDPAKEIAEIVPWQVPNAAFTAAQGLLTQIRIQSNDVNVEPCRFITEVTQGGLGATFTAFVPPLNARPLNIKIKGGERINTYGTSQVANTVAPLVGATYIVTERQSGRPEFYYEKPNNETLTGTTVNTRTTGDAITVSGVSAITKWYFALTNLVNTVSESVCGTVEFQSSDFNTSMPQSYSIQPYGTFLGATGALLTAQNTEYGLLEPIQPKTRGTLTINNFYTNRVVFTAAGNFITGLQFVK